MRRGVKVGELFGPTRVAKSTFFTWFCLVFTLFSSLLNPFLGLIWFRQVKRARVSLFGKHFDGGSELCGQLLSSAEEALHSRVSCLYYSCCHTHAKASKTLQNTRKA